MTQSASSRRRTAAKHPPVPQRRLSAGLAGGIEGDFYKYMVAGMRNGVLAITREGTLLLINDIACEVLGLRDGQRQLGRPIAEAFEHHPEILFVLADVFERDHLQNRAEMRLKPSGKVIGYTLSHITDDRGQLVGASMFFKDLTRVEQLNERERLRDRLVAIGELAAVFAHEVKNPLAGIEVMAGHLRRKVGDAPELQSMLTDIIGEAKMANAIVQEVLDFVRPIRLQVEPTQLCDAAQAAVQHADAKGRRGSIEVETRVPPTLPQIRADKHQLTQVLTNLIVNAYEALDGEGRVCVTASETRLQGVGGGRDAILVEVADDGPGIPADVREKVFDIFFTTKPQGSGLGLAIVKRIVDAHDGRLDLQTSSEGTRVRVTLPLAGIEDGL
ncbi:MAG TPA: ATP-binding protein [Vicinamibacterales bacterium]|nr:ATP-binding protein [Vicinamibacterales bacterium]